MGDFRADTTSGTIVFFFQQTQYLFNVILNNFCKVFWATKSDMLHCAPLCWVFSQTNTAYVCFKLEMHMGSAGCAVAFVFVSAAKSTSSCRLQGLLGVFGALSPISACQGGITQAGERGGGGEGLEEPQRRSTQPRLNNTVAMTSLMGCWTLPRWWIGTCQTGKLCTIGLDWVLLLSHSLSPSLSLSFCHQPPSSSLSPPFQLFKLTYWLSYRHLVAK